SAVCPSDPPTSRAIAHAGSSSPSRAEPSTATRPPDGTRSDPPPSPGDKLEPLHTLLRRERHDHAPQHALAVLATRVERERAAEAGLSARLADVPVQAEHPLAGLDPVPHGGGPHAREHRRARPRDRPELVVHATGRVQGG